MNKNNDLLQNTIDSKNLTHNAQYHNMQFRIPTREILKTSRKQTKHIKIQFIIFFDTKKYIYPSGCINHFF